MGFSETAGKFQILLLTNELCAKRRFADITVADICEAAGISRAAFYRLFPDKFALNNWCQAFNFAVGIRQIGRSYSWANGLYMAYSCAHFFANIARASYGGQDGASSVSFSQRCIRACLRDTLENVRHDDVDVRLAFQIDFLAGALAKASPAYWSEPADTANVRSYADQLAGCVPPALFAALDEPVDPQPTFEVNAGTLARAARLMDEGFFQSV